MTDESLISKLGRFINKKNLDSSISLPSGSFPLADADIANMSASKLLGGANNNFLRWLAGVPTWINLALADITGALGFTPENTANKGIAGGYADLDGGGLLPAARLTLARIVAIMGFTSENVANKGIAGGYADLNGASALTKNLAAVTQVPPSGVNGQVLTTVGGVSAWAASGSFTAQNNVTIGGITDTLEHFILSGL